VDEILLLKDNKIIKLIKEKIRIIFAPGNSQKRSNGGTK
jgi:hypothetical protein